MWLVGAPVTIASTNAPQALTSTVGLVKQFRIQQHWSNTNKIYWGDSTLAPATPAGVGGWLQAPSASLAPSETISEVDAINGINAGQIYVTGTANEIILWSYIVQ